MSVVKPFPVEEEYKKNKGIKPADVKRLREWIKKQPHLPNEHITDLDLILAYHCCNHSTEVTKQVLDLNLTLKTMFTKIFSDRVVDDNIARTLRGTILTPLPAKTEDGYRCIYGNFSEKNPKKVVLTDVFKVTNMITDLLQYEEGTWPGVIIISDLSSVSLGHLACFNLELMQQYFYFMQEAMMYKIKSMHIINAPPFMDRLMALIKPLMKKELIDLFHIHKAGSTTLNEFYPINALPKDAGGEYLTLEECSNNMIAKLKANQEFFDKEMKKRVVETKRPGKAKTVSDFFSGVEGSFKKLDID